MPAQQQSGEPGAVYKQVAFYLTVCLAANRGDVPRCVGIHSGYMIENVFDAEHLRAMFLQQRRELPGVEMIAVIDDGSIFGRRALLRGQVPGAQVALRADRVGERDALAQCLPARRQVRLQVAVRQ